MVILDTKPSGPKVENDFLVYQSDAMALGYCADGMRKFSKYHNFNYLDFVHNGIPAQLLLDTNDVLALAVVEQARKRRT